jgi:hypothetical protein
LQNCLFELKNSLCVYLSCSSSGAERINLINREVTSRGSIIDYACKAFNHTCEKQLLEEINIFHKPDIEKNSEKERKSRNTKKERDKLE